MLQTAAIIAVLSLLPGLTAHAESSLRGMETAETFRLGPVLNSGISLGQETPGDRQFYQLELRGESPAHGFSRIYLRTISLYELLDLPKLNDDSGAIENTVRFHHQFISLGMESPLFYEWTSPFDLEWGWAGGFTLAQVKFKGKDKVDSTGFSGIVSDYPELQPSSLGAQQKTNAAQSDAQFAGGEIGSYVRYYGLYPFVPYTAAHLSLGSFLDTDALIHGVEQSSTSNSNTQNSDAAIPSSYRRIYQSSFRTGASITAGFEIYLGSRGIFGLEYLFWNWNFDRSQDWSHFLIFKAGFLF